MSKDTKIYYVEAISLKEKDIASLTLEHQLHNLKYNKKMSFEDYVNVQKRWKQDRYSISSFISSYHIDKDMAMKYIKENVGDINECGSYEYAALVSAEIDVSYYECNQTKEEDVILFKFDNETKSYVELEKTADEYFYLQKYVLHIFG